MLPLKGGFLYPPEASAKPPPFCPLITIVIISTSAKPNTANLHMITTQNHFPDGRKLLYVEVVEFVDCLLYLFQNKADAIARRFFSSKSFAAAVDKFSSVESSDDSLCPEKFSGFSSSGRIGRDSGIQIFVDWGDLGKVFG